MVWVMAADRQTDVKTMGDRLRCRNVPPCFQHHILILIPPISLAVTIRLSAYRLFFVCIFTVDRAVSNRIVGAVIIVGWNHILLQGHIFTTINQCMHVLHVSILHIQRTNFIACGFKAPMSTNNDCNNDMHVTIPTSP